jgi:phosphatidylglycerophosphate synthase
MAEQGTDHPGPYDQRLARLLVRPLAATPIHPNHLTTLSLLLGFASALVFAVGGPGDEHWAALMFMLAVLVDHTDGELARMTGKTSTFGHYYDYVVGSANYTMLFIGIGLGLARGEMGDSALILGLAAGLANPIIVALRLTIERRHGAEAVEHPSTSAFELEDFIYLVGPMTWLGGLKYFLLVFGFGTLAYLAWTVWELARREVRKHG